MLSDDARASGSSRNADGTIDVPTYFRRAMLVPVFLSAGAMCLAPLTDSRFSPRIQVIGELAAVIFLAGIFGAIPYALFVSVLWLAAKPETERDFRLAAWLAPVLCSTTFALAVYLLGGGSPAHGAPAWYILSGMAAPGLLVGYAQVVLIEGTLWVALRRGWVARRQFSEVLTFDAEQCRTS